MAVEKDPNYQEEYARAKAALQYRRTVRLHKVASGMYLSALKEPRGFIRCIEWILAIFAFATTTSQSSKSSFNVTCPNKETKSYDIPFSYPFRLNSVQFKLPFCQSLANITDGVDKYTCYGDFASASEFYVFVGVMAFLYCMAALAIYIFFDEKYRKMDLIPIVDFVTTAVFAVLFLIASSAWAQNLTHLKYYSSPETVFGHLKECSAEKGAECTSTAQGNFASLNVSIIFGFLNMAVWAANLWFLFKETKWFKVQSAPPVTNMPPTEQPQRV